MPSPQIVADENIPFVAELFGHLGSVRLMSGRDVTRENVRDADVLLVRSVTRVGPSLLDGSRVRFVGSATIGTDHIETEFLHQREIAFASAPGSNADSVVEYVLAALFRVAARLQEPLRGKTLGIIGCGNIGSRLAVRAQAIGMDALRNDPPLARRSGAVDVYVTLPEILDRSDIVTCHVPLIKEGPDRTLHLLGADEIERLSERAWLVNTSRGGVVDNRALLHALRAGRGPAATVLDVWEDEPHPAAELIEHVDVATPHIAGYSHEGKVNGVLMLLDALSRHLGRDAKPTHAAIDTTTICTGAPDPALPETDWLAQLVRRMYDISADDRRMRSGWPADVQAASDHFTSLRRNYPTRRTFGAYRLRAAQVPEARREAAAKGIGVRLAGQASV